jgi:hypothetical protein
MILQAPDIRYGLDKAQEIADIYATESQFASHERKSVKELLRLCKSYLNKKITVSFLNREYEEGGSIRGYCVAYEDRYQICLFGGMNRCWRRFVLAKELFHVILDDDRYRTMDIYGHLEEFMTKIPIPVVAGPACVSEALAELAATEFMFPYATRSKVAGTDSSVLAERFKIPQVLVESYTVPTFMQQLGFHMQKRA